MFMWQRREERKQPESIVSICEAASAYLWSSFSYQLHINVFS